MSDILQQLPPRSAKPFEESEIFTLAWYRWFGRIKELINQNLGGGANGVATLAPLTPTGNAGSLTIVNGIITLIVSPT